ncbi:AT-hook motif nuclear-localized protein 18 [Brachypodium distachyon]|uniref:PPC domain-containing protein n=1 Tax=Brachypodium distachyon TaxID=15368 RepID=A0A0Q3JQD8_BRADI|nr:AT-hook motif nuclear-localized protein 18 [Brachypodium distachyon]KQK19955.1 hypothetical protein BRADI_1g51520v3 [Brachypodium distachyon]|eukprot:XP_014752002.1 AT-hook motif nuclear-localized protein 18 [Brachypodium distachyon]
MDPVAAHGGGGGRHHFGPPVGSPFHSPFHGSHGHGAGGQFQQQAAPQFQAYELHGHQAQMLANSMGGGGGNSGSSMLAKQELVDESTINSAGSNSAGEQGMGSAEPQIMGQTQAGGVGGGGEDPHQQHGAAGLRQGVMRRPRGRPAGSKNKPKPPVIITRDSASALRAHVLEVAPGCDVVDAVADFARRRQVGVCVLSATGSVAGISVRQPGGGGGSNGNGNGGVVSIAGRFDILTLSGSFLPQPAPPSATGLTVYVSGGSGQVVGGAVAGALVATGGPVVIMAASFGNASYERLPLDDEPPQSAAPDLAPLPAPLHQQQQQQQSLAMMNAIQLPGDEDEAGGYGGWASAGAGSSRVGPY